MRASEFESLNKYRKMHQTKQYQDGAMASFMANLSWNKINKLHSDSYIGTYTEQLKRQADKHTEL